MRYGTELTRKNGAMLLPALAMAMTLCGVWQLIYVTRHIADRQMGRSRFYQTSHAGERAWLLLVLQDQFSLTARKQPLIMTSLVPERISHYTHKTCQIKISIP